jgi:hypothetical protein
MVVGLRHKERQTEIEHGMKLHEARCKKDNGKTKEMSKPESSSQRGDQKKLDNKGQMKTWFSETSTSKEKAKTK